MHCSGFGTNSTPNHLLLVGGQSPTLRNPPRNTAQPVWDMPSILGHAGDHGLSWAAYTGESSYPVAFYEQLAPVANRWADLLSGDNPTFPLTHELLLARCQAAGQTRPTPLMLRYHEGDWNALHQDLYGDVYFPFQVLTVLSDPDTDYAGGEFVLIEQRPRAQSRAHVLRPARGAFVIFPTRERPQRGKNGYHRIGLRHGVSTVTAGTRTALGIIFHDAK